jgi:hypothetical protein
MITGVSLLLERKPGTHFGREGLDRNREGAHTRLQNGTLELKTEQLIG